MSGVISDPDILTKDQKLWFAGRMDESHTGRVLVPSHLYEKFRKIADRPYLSNQAIKSWLIEHVYNARL